MRIKTTLLAVIAAAMMLAMSGTALANGAGSGAGGGRGGGEVRGHGLAVVNSFDFDVVEHSADPHDASGYFRAVGFPPPGNQLVVLQGPARCVDIRGDTAGFLYPISQGSRPGVLIGQAVLISVKDGGPTGPDFIGFTGPAPMAGFGNQCAPTLAGAIQPVTSGAITVTDRQ